jgi:hypothetical protein
MGNKNKRRAFASRVLLAVFLPMLFISFFHIHEYQPNHENECAQCVNHQPHSGHFTTMHMGVHDCVICQMCHLPYVAATVLITVFILTPTLCALTDCSSLLPIGSIAYKSTRAPPYIL